MRKIIIAGNWKMNLNINEAKSLYNSIIERAQNSSQLNKIIIFPPYPYLVPLKELSQNEFIYLGAQNIASQASGAFTGEVSSAMIKSLGVNYTLIGHSERRAYFGESHDILKKKVDLALENSLNPIFCCGESLEERNANRQEILISNQLNDSIFHLNKNQISELTIAYEPVWAIGTGETATSQQAEDMHAFIRNLIKEKYGNEIADSMSILYGGSCNASNSKELFNMENVDGGLIGGASLKLEEFLQMIAQLNE